VARQDAEELIAEVEKVVEELMLYEALQILTRIEADLSNGFGLFHCFSLVKHPRGEGWLFSLPGTPERGQNGTSERLNSIA
jgi:hypothetical protein